MIKKITTILVLLFMTKSIEAQRFYASLGMNFVSYSPPEEWYPYHYREQLEGFDFLIPNLSISYRVGYTETLELGVTSDSFLISFLDSDLPTEGNSIDIPFLFTHTFFKPKDIEQDLPITPVGYYLGAGLYYSMLSLRQRYIDGKGYAEGVEGYENDNVGVMLRAGYNVESKMSVFLELKQDITDYIENTHKRTVIAVGFKFTLFKI